ncbi:MAG: sodium-dependent transporter [Parachlamydiales bacterium]
MKAREHWGSHLGLVFAAAGSAIGLGSLWKFPYVTGQNGGGAFVILYLFSTLVICVPLFIAELIMGRASQRGVVGAFANLSHSRNWRLVGWLAILSTLIVFSYYNVVAGWTLNYVLLSLAQFTQGRSAEQIEGVFNVLVGAGDISIFWMTAFLVITGAVIYGGVQKGIEHWSKILMPALFILLLGLLCYSVTLPGFGQAVRFMLYPDFSALTPSGVLAALGLSFFTASLGFGIILTYGSYMRKEENIPKTALTVLGLTLAISVVAGLIIFPIIFTFGFPAAEGPGLVFKILPVLFSQLPATLILSTVFFLLLVFTALTSTVSLLENLVANGMELFNWSRKRATLLTMGLVFLVGIPSALAGSGHLFPSWEAMYGENFFDTVSTTWDRWFLPIAGFFTAIFVGWRMDKGIRDEEFLSQVKWRWTLPLWKALIRYVVPTVIVVFILEAAGVLNL